MPGSTWKLGAQCWQLQVNDESFKLMVIWLVNKQLMKPENIRQPLNKAMLEEASQLCALVTAVKGRAMAAHPIKPEVMTDFVDQFLSGANHNLELELQAELQLKNNDFNPSTHATFIKEMVSKHTQEAAAAVGKSVVQVEAAALDRAQFELLETQLKYDFQVLSVYQKSMRSNTVAQYQAKRGWTVRRHQTICDNVESWLMDRTYNIQADKGAVACLRDIYSSIIKVKEKHDNMPNDAIYTITWTNWVSTSLIKAQEFQVHGQVLGLVAPSHPRQSMINADS